MGYNTNFRGEFSLSPNLTDAQVNYIQKFSETRRMKRDTAKLPATGSHADVGLSIGTQGGYYVDGPGFAGQDHTPDVVDFNNPPLYQPSLWCHWTVAETNLAGEPVHTIVWDESEKFCEYVSWIKYMIEHFFLPWGISVSGTMYWRGEDFTDNGVIEIIDNCVRVRS